MMEALRIMLSARGRSGYFSAEYDSKVICPGIDRIGYFIFGGGNG